MDLTIARPHKKPAFVVHRRARCNLRYFRIEHPRKVGEPAVDVRKAVFLREVGGEVNEPRLSADVRVGGQCHRGAADKVWSFRFQSPRLILRPAHLFLTIKIVDSFAKAASKGNEMYVLGEMDKGALAVGRVVGHEDEYVMYLVCLEKGRILESSKHLTEDELREILTESYGESDTEIESRIALAKAHPYGAAIKAKIAQHRPPEGTATHRDVRKIPQGWWAVLLEKFRKS